MNVGVCVSTGIVFLDWTLPPVPVASVWKVREEHPAWMPAGPNSVFFKLTGMRDWRFSLWVTSKAKRSKHVDSLDWLDLNHHFCGVFLFLEHLWVHLFCFSFHVGECKLALRWTRRKIKIYIFISSRFVSLIFGPSCCCYTIEYVAERIGGLYISQGYLSESECNSAIEIRTPNYNSAVYRFNYNTTRTPHKC